MPRTKGAAGWSYKTGEKGRNRVRVFEDHTRGMIFAEIIERDPATGAPRKRRIALEHADRERAKLDAERMAAALREAVRLPEAFTTLGAVCQLYTEQVTPTKGAQKQAHDRRAVILFLRCFGANRRAADLNAADWRRFIDARRSGRLRPHSVRKAVHVGDRQITYDLKALRAMLTWATVVQDDGRRLLDRNPLDGLPYPNGDPVARPVLEQDAYEALLRVSSAAHPLFRLALVLAHETGHRSGAIRQLRWSDVQLDEDPAKCSIRWRGENDKQDFDHTTPATEAAVIALRDALRASAAIGEAPLFPDPRQADRPCSRHVFNKWWEKAETLAGLEKVDRRRWHSLRRKWATETKGMPLKDQAHAGGWKSTRVLQDIYTQPDWETMRAGLASRSTLRKVAG
jgi:integrase